MTEHINCPHCGSDQRGHPITGTDPVEFYSRTFVVEIQGVYDGGLFYQCPDCGGRWHRWPIGSDLHKRAEKYVSRGGA